MPIIFEIVVTELFYCFFSEQNWDGQTVSAVETGILQVDDPDIREPLSPVDSIELNSEKSTSSDLVTNKGKKTKRFKKKSAREFPNKSEIEQYLIGKLHPYN